MSQVQKIKTRIYLSDLYIFLFIVKYIVTSNGKELVMLNNYTYRKHCRLKSGHRLQCCMSVSRRCHAYLIIDNSGYVLKRNERHTHEPSAYARNMAGAYIRI